MTLANLRHKACVAVTGRLLARRVERPTCWGGNAGPTSSMEVDRSDDATVVEIAFTPLARPQIWLLGNPTHSSRPPLLPWGLERSGHLDQFEMVDERQFLFGR